MLNVCFSGSKIPRAVFGGSIFGCLAATLQTRSPCVHINAERFDNITFQPYLTQRDGCIVCNVYVCPATCGYIARTVCVNDDDRFIPRASKGPTKIFLRAHKYRMYHSTVDRLQLKRNFYFRTRALVRCNRCHYYQHEQVYEFERYQLFSVRWLDEIEFSQLSIF